MLSTTESNYQQFIQRDRQKYRLFIFTLHNLQLDDAQIAFIISSLTSQPIKKQSDYFGRHVPQLVLQFTLSSDVPTEEPADSHISNRKQPVHSTMLLDDGCCTMH